MPTPKSVTKIDKTGNVTFISEVDKVEFQLFELTRAALRDVGKFVVKEWKMRYYQHFKKRTGKSMHAIKSKVFSSRNTIYPRIEIGLPHSYKGNPVDGFYAFFQEFGTSRTPKLGLLTHAVKDNIDTIRDIEAQYLEYIERPDEEIEAIIDEEETEDED